jgi:hypothetical protein
MTGTVGTEMNKAAHDKKRTEIQVEMDKAEEQLRGMLLENKEFASKNIEKVRFEKELEDSVKSSDLSEGELADKFGSDFDSDAEFED